MFLGGQHDYFCRPMKQAFFALLLTVSFGLTAQEVTHHAITLNGDEMGYAQIKHCDSCSEWIIGLRDSDTIRWSTESWAQELFRFGDETKRNVLVPKSEAVQWSEEAFIKLFEEVQTTADQCVTVCLGTGAQEADDLISMGVAGLMISPVTDSTTEMDSASCAVVIRTRKDDSASVVGLKVKQSGGFLKPVEVVSGDYYYIDNSSDVYLSALSWIDSVKSTLTDTTIESMTETRQLTLVPDVFRGTRHLNMVFDVAQHGEFDFSVVDLSLNSIFEKTEYLGKGRNYVSVKIGDMPWGIYHLIVQGPGFKKEYKFMFRG